MQKLLPALGVFLLACCTVSAGETRQVSKGRNGRIEDKSVVAPAHVPLSVGVHRRDDYRGGYNFELDRYARMTRWRDPAGAPAPRTWAK